MTPNSSDDTERSFLSQVELCCVCRGVIEELEKTQQLQYPIGIPALVAIAKKWAAPDVVAYRVELHPRAWGSAHVAGMLTRYEDHAKIIYSLRGNTCWRRFVIAKELAHLLLDDSDSYTRDPVALVHGLINDVPALNTSDLNSEYISPLAAVELLLPWKLRQQLYDWETEGQTQLQIAQRCRVPEKVVNLALSAGFRAISESANSCA